MRHARRDLPHRRQPHRRFQMELELAQPLPLDREPDDARKQRRPQLRLANEVVRSRIHGGAFRWGPLVTGDQDDGDARQLHAKASHDVVPSPVTELEIGDHDVRWRARRNADSVGQGLRGFDVKTSVRDPQTPANVEFIAWVVADEQDTPPHPRSLAAPEVTS